MLIEQITQALTAVRQQKPLVVNITNYVVMNNTANALLAIGASPIMAHSKQEMAEMNVVRWRTGYQHRYPRQRLDTAHELCRRASQCQR